MYDATYVKGSKAPNQNTDTPQEIGRDKFVPKTAGGKDGAVGPGSGKLEKFPPTKKHVTTSTGKHRARMAPAPAKGGGNKQVSFTAPKSRVKFSTEKSCGKNEFIPKKACDYGVGGV